MSNAPDPRVAFIGGGNMARALIGGLLQQGLPAQLLSVGEPQASTRESLGRDLHVHTTADNGEAVRAAQVVVLAVKPQSVATVLPGLQAALQVTRPVLLSIVAGLRLADLARLCPPDLPIVRAMPNRPALVGAGVTALYAAPAVAAAQRALVERIATAAGRWVWLQREAELDVVTALSGSGPAYFFLLAEQMAQAAVTLGLEGDTATLLAVETLYGSAALARGSQSLAQQRAAVTSRGGTTEAALRILETGGFNALIASALAGAAARSIELADSLGSAQRS
jgi:pyrroline-5-carboxylate reductase